MYSYFNSNYSLFHFCLFVCLVSQWWLCVYPRSKSKSEYHRQCKITQQNIKWCETTQGYPERKGFCFTDCLCQINLVFKVGLLQKSCSHSTEILKHWWVKFPELMLNAHCAQSVGTQYWLFVLAIYVNTSEMWWQRNMLGLKNLHTRKRLARKQSELLNGWKSSAKTVDPQLHLKGMEVWKQSHKKNT